MIRSWLLVALAMAVAGANGVIAVIHLLWASPLTIVCLAGGALALAIGARRSRLLAHTTHSARSNDPRDAVLLVLASIYPVWFLSA